MGRYSNTHRDLCDGVPMVEKDTGLTSEYSMVSGNLQPSGIEGVKGQKLLRGIISYYGGSG